MELWFRLKTNKENFCITDVEDSTNYIQISKRQMRKILKRFGRVRRTGVTCECEFCHKNRHRFQQQIRMIFEKLSSRSGEIYIESYNRMSGLVISSTTVKKLKRWVNVKEHARNLGRCAVCAQSFVLYRPQQRFCSKECRHPAQNESKRRWWNKHRRGKIR